MTRETGEQITALAEGFAAVPALDSISFTMRPVDMSTVAALIETHGVPRLVRAAAETKTGNVRKATAFLDTWSSLKPRHLAQLAPISPPCRECNLPEQKCQAAQRRWAAEDRHPFTERNSA